MDDVALIPPLQGCLYCHQQGTTLLSEGRKFFGFGNDYPTLKCTHCESVALLDTVADAPQDWRIRYRRVNHDPEYYYVAIHLGEAGWLSGDDALAISTNGYVQRQRREQVANGDLTWLNPAPLRPPPPLMSPSESVYLTLKGVTFQETPPPGILVRPDQGAVLDSGKFYVTDQKLHLLGQRRDWSHRLIDIMRIDYDDHAWTLVLNTPGEPRQYRGLNTWDQLDAQLVSAVVDELVLLAQA